MAVSEPGPSERRAPRLDDFLGEPTRDIFDWRWLWEGDRAFPIRSNRGVLGRVVVAVKRLLRPLVKVPQNDLWERQRIFNLGYFTWVEQQGISLADFDKRRSQDFWRGLQNLVPQWDEMITAFNRDSGMAAAA